MLLITIAYNDENLIKTQIKLVKKYVKDSDMRHIIVDNSPDKNKRLLIKAVCGDEDIEYIPVPRHIDRFISTRLFWYGLSHGAALNSLKPLRFALLDHDILPIKECNMTQQLGTKDFYGVYRNRGKAWYLWPGFSIFNFDIIAKTDANFLPIMLDNVYMDAGGSNYNSLYKYYNTADGNMFAVVKTHRLTVSTGVTDVYHRDCIQIVDSAWLHIINGSNYARVQGKEKTVTKIIANIDKFVQFVNQ